ncbi:hypothetical protein BLA24064_00641 [Burkholderia latens]|uniref:Uncharacterized protein n=1 Tax=Burkholderia latens TaxID=488446 RepID=A0A6P2HHM1_9BURK|nr:hypothetical protein BLA24064_00641 [Burkholderia latens]
MQPVSAFVPRAVSRMFVGHSCVYLPLQRGHLVLGLHELCRCRIALRFQFRDMGSSFPLATIDDSGLLMSRIEVSFELVCTLFHHGQSLLGLRLVDLEPC